jgi:mannosyl-3-phosphoglycerate phosphatase
MESRYVVFTDLDGSLLDPYTYSYELAEPALQALRERRVPVVLCTSKTRAEVEAIRERLNNRDPFIVENGAAAYVPPGYFPFEAGTIRWGVVYSEVVEAVQRAAAATGCPVRGFHQMSATEVAERCGLGREEAERARQREYDEPLEILTDDPERVGAFLQRLEAEGLTWTRGGRFYHARGNHNKGLAAQALAALYRLTDGDIITVGLGDGPNDVSLLAVVDIPIAVRGPQDWNREILKLLNARLPTPDC